jgi:manganese transport protein
VIIVGFLVNLFRVDVDVPAAAAGLVPGFADTGSVLLATGILGATVMPHVIYLHSALTQNRIPAPDAGGRRRLLRYQRLDVLIAMGLAGLVNMSMLIIAAALFHGGGTEGTDSLEGVHAALGGIDRTAALAFALALLASGFASSGVGTLAGQVVLQGYLRRRIPLLLRRALTLAPALAVLAIGIDPTQALVISQVVLSFGIPFALVPLVLVTRRRDIMGELVNRPVTTAVASGVAAVIIALNAFLLAQLMTG